MAFYKCLFFVSLIFSSVFVTMSQQACTPQAFKQKTFAACHNLPILNSTIHWNYYPSKGTVDVAFVQAVVSDSRWVAWAINPTSTGMVGSQAIVAFQRTDGAISVYSSPIKSYGTRLEQGNLSFPLFDVSAVYKNNQIVIFATVGLPNNVSIVNHVWQQGPLSGNTPQMHSVSGPNVESFGALDFLSGKVETVRRGTSSVFRVKISHGIINTISWGILMPVGAIVARHFKAADPAWFHVHRACQMLGYFGGVAGFATGLWLGHKSSGVEYKGHRCMGITLISLAALQVLVALSLRPNKTDKKRVFWNWFHYLVGYGTIILGIVNILKGFDMLQPGKWWKFSYLITIGVLG
ncbi:cytochrome b561 and DOMON domain-containing protein At5g47530-like [Prunus avium]|uniref:Cytochrome b561 and DOMON domain-containing protein At5g47530-like n=1 Tax=Prunus avium TaxID=42229 RepID=A0A6P5S0C4_PRUAV|nr:cytochrome b561 and DOMON domain-containing protein At5g47530-like [Prunus avium]